MIKYYFMMDSLKDNVPLGLYLIDYADLSEKWWNRELSKWEPNDGLYYSIISGDLDYEQCSVEQAKEFAPKAFQKDGE
jgi:hypothetical protein